MAWGREKGTDVKISALPVSMRFFDFVPCSLPLKTLILLTFSCFLIRRRGTGGAFFVFLCKKPLHPRDAAAVNGKYFTKMGWEN